MNFIILSEKENHQPSRSVLSTRLIVWTHIKYGARVKNYLFLVDVKEVGNR